jgi:hypothetical protein|eukprot:COSAG06_NODE_4812_length_3937_cov_2.416102_6_plen_89_part_00
MLIIAHMARFLRALGIPQGAPSKLWLISAISALPIVMFFYFDQNLSSLLTQQPYMNLRFGSYYHSSFLAMGVFVSPFYCRVSFPSWHH